MNRTIEVLDVTLRDGGCVNDFKFGQVYMDKILTGLEESGVDIIELGYIDNKNGGEQGITKFCDEQVIVKHFLKKKKPGVKYVVMMDYGKFDVDKLTPYDGSGIDGIRLAFHKKDRVQAVELGRKIAEKGYQIFIQPMITMRYSDAELIELINLVNSDLPNAACFYIVDSFGEMRTNDMNRVLNLVDHNLISSMPIGFHSHNNLQLSYSNAMSLLSFPTKRKLMIDASTMGMGKGAGNLNTELLLEHLNLYHQGTYKIAPLLKIIDQVIKVIHREFYWGYSAEYYLSSINHCTPSYASYFYGKHMLAIDEVAELLSRISEDKKISFDRQYAEELYRQYNEEKVADDFDMVTTLKEKFREKTILVVAPGKSIIKANTLIQKVMEDEDTISISLNNKKFDTDYIFITRKDAYGWARECGKSIIVPSNVEILSNKDTYVIDYKKWIIEDDEIQDASGVLVLNLLKHCEVKKIVMAGFDGFSGDVNDNYYDKNMRISMNSYEAEVRNEFYTRYISELKKYVSVEFLTPSLYNPMV